MSLTVQLKNIGIIKQAEFSLGDLTLICGENNTGKTYATYALYGFLKSWRNFIRFSMSTEHVDNLLTEGSLKIDLEQYVEKADQMLSEACERYTMQLYEFFAAPEDRFQDSRFDLHSKANNNIWDSEIDATVGILQKGHLDYSKQKGSKVLTVTVVVEKEQRKIDPDYVGILLSFIILDTIFSGSFPTPFISSAERTGVAIFRKELNFARNRLVEEMGQAGQKIDPRELLFKAYQSYPSPVEDNVDFTRELEDIAKRKSFITKEYPEVLADFADIIGGEYAITQNDELHYIPKGTRLKLTMDQSSSAVRSLLDIGFYLRCIAKKGDLLMVDEPELNLHPENQRRIARLFARLVNLEIKVFITTHSDYIVKELNTLIMLNNDKPHLKRIVEESNYKESELIKADQVKLYVAEKALMPLEERQKRRKRAHTLVPADIDPEFGIEARSFDKTIDTMNKIQRDIVWGAKQDK